MARHSHDRRHLGDIVIFIALPVTPLTVAMTDLSELIGTTITPQRSSSGGTRRRIAVFRALQLGDMLCAVPALRAVREGEPDAHITLIGLPWAKEFALRYSHLVDDFMSFPGMPGLPEQPYRPADAEVFYHAARAREFDLAIQLHGSCALSNEVARRLDAKALVGFCASVEEAGLHRGGREHLVSCPQGNEIERLLVLPHVLGYPRVASRLEFPLRPQDYVGWKCIASEHDLQADSYVCIHPGARMLSRRWPWERYAEVARMLADRWPVVVTGAADEQALARLLCSQVGAKVINLCGRTSLGEMGALIAHARLLVCNDTGVSHIASATETPSVVVSCGTDSWRRAPLDGRRHRILADYPPCRPCNWEKCPLGHVCATHISVEAVMREIDSLTTVDWGLSHACAVA